MKKKEKVYIDVSRCKGCRYCVQACPKQAISIADVINENGYAVIQVDEEVCIACGMCYKVCPDYVFELR